jgi:glycosyltransferase involved in cell wall biosynthesis
MHIAFDGGCFQQGILGGIYQVAKGFLNAAKAANPDLQVTLVCDPRQGLVRQSALDGLTWRPDAVYASVASSYDEPERWPTTPDPNVRFFVDGRVVPAALDVGLARYQGPVPTRAFAIVSRAARPADSGPDGDGSRRGVLIERLLIRSDGRTVRISSQDRRLAVGFLGCEGDARWTDGAAFIPLDLFPEKTGSVSVDVFYTQQESYALQPGIAAEAVLKARKLRRDLEREGALATLAERLRAAGCKAYFANHFTPISIPGLINVAWAHDVIPLLHPQYFHADAQFNFRENVKMFGRADRVYANSECTRKDLIEHTAVQPTKVIAAGIASSGAFGPREDGVLGPILSQLGLRQRGYILAVATVEPRKNHLRLLHGYLQLRRRLPDCPDLVIVGTMGWDYQKMMTFRSENGLEGLVKTFSDRSEEDLICLYSGALFSVYLSVYEGFGLPILEAMMCGCPVLTSDRSSMPEVAGGAATLVNPYDVDAIADALHEMATNGQLRANLSKRGKSRSQVYSWEKSSRVIMDDLSRFIATA